MSGNIILIGMPGAGKSTVGVVLAKTLGYDFIDTDIVLSRTIGSTLQDYINAQGVEAFLQAEETMAKSLTCSGTVVATGGSVVLSEEAMNYLKRDSTTVFLDVSLHELEKRLGNIKTRGVTLRPGQSIAGLFSERLPLYRLYADIVVPDGLGDMNMYGSNGQYSLEDMVTMIVQRLRI